VTEQVVVAIGSHHHFGQVACDPFRAPIPVRDAPFLVNKINPVVQIVNQTLVEVGFWRFHGIILTQTTGI
jgi:hypothetical protein